VQLQPLPARLRQSPVLVLLHLILMSERASERNGKTSTQWSDKYYYTTRPQAAAARTPGGALPLPMHAGSTHAGSFPYLKKPLLRGGARPKYGDTIITFTARVRAVPAPEATAHSSRLGTAVPRCGGCGRSLFPFPRSRFVLSSPSPDVRSVQRHHAFPPAGRRPAAVRAKATTDTAPCLGRGRPTRNVPRRRRAGPRLITA
jgi:hypothetical protein